MGHSGMRWVVFIFVFFFVAQGDCDIFCGLALSLYQSATVRNAMMMENVLLLMIPSNAKATAGHIAPIIPNWLADNGHFSGITYTYMQNWT